jgi:hypothetical protein
MTDTQDGRWPVWKLGVLLYPFVAAAVAINLFLLALVGLALGLPSLSPVEAILLSFPLGLPASWASAVWVRRLMGAAEHRDFIRPKAATSHEEGK